MRKLLSRIIGLEGYEVLQADSCKSGMKQLVGADPEVVLCDVCLPDGSGVDLVMEMKKINPLVEIIILTAHGNIPDGVQAIKNGAFDYITKGDDNNKIIPLRSRAMEKAKAARKVQRLEENTGKRYSSVPDTFLANSTTSFSERDFPNICLLYTSHLSG